MIIYNIFPTLAGPFSKWGPHIKRAADMGFDWLFINPIQYPGYSGSLYSISDYFKINPALLDKTAQTPADAQVKAMLDEAHAGGLKVMMDLVINHCAFDSPLIKQHPEWFMHEGGQIAHPFAMDDKKKVVWEDLARFDYEHTSDPEGLFKYCLEVTTHLCRLGFDGFRCDAAYQIPGAFWKRLIKEVKAKHPNKKICFAAETLGCTVQQTLETAKSGFDYIFNSAKWWDLSEPWLIEQYELLREVVPSISFPESHDSERLCSELNGSLAGLKQRYLFTSLFSTGFMIPIGFEFGFKKRLHVVETKPADWEAPTHDLREYIAKVNALKKKHVVFHSECAMEVLPYQNPNILLMWKASPTDSSESLLILNKDVNSHQEFATDNIQHYFQIRGELLDVSPEYPMEYIPEPFHYALRPGQGIVLVTKN